MASHPADQPTDIRWMHLALSLGRRGMGRTWPNPAVGCVIVKDGRVLGRGWTQQGGRPHAETMALAQAGTAAKGATAYITLEPCAHHGKTPPCAAALIAAKVKRVVTALSDPDPRVSGKGHDMLKAAGITVDTGCLKTQAARDHAGFLKRVTQNLPFLSLKLATSFDGRIATATGESQWITGAAARRLVHLIRARHDAVLIGSGTAKADDPSLNVRDLGPMPQPVRVVFDTNLATDPASKLGQSAGEIPLWLCHGSSADTTQSRSTSANLFACKTTPDGKLDPKDVLQTLAAQGLTRVFCEGGGQLAASLLAENLVDQLIGFTAGLTLGAKGTAAIATLPDLPLAAHPRFTLSETRQIGPDLMHIWRKP
jgi:diaminohydroxyphosphoribosylaminopyrimidine deaminase / 5-amino-6-(5-phosphoribosylamino)uracil reductase